MSKQSLMQNLKQLEGLVREIKTYLRSDLLRPATFPKLADVMIGNYLMRQNRLLALRSSPLIAPHDQTRLDEVVSRFDDVVYHQEVEFRQRIYQELEICLGQWDNYLRGLEEEKFSNAYGSAVETRVIIEDILQKLCFLAQPIETHLIEKIEQLDFNLHQRWRPGSFIWSAEWQSVYPPKIYWWLYGEPCPKINFISKAAPLPTANFIAAANPL